MTAMSPATLEIGILWRLLGCSLLYAAGVYLMVTSLPALRPKPDLRTRLRWMDVDERVRMEAERLPQSPMFDSPRMEAVFRPLFEELGEGLSKVRARLGIGDIAELEQKLSISSSGLTAGQFYGKKLLLAAIGGSPWLGNFVGIHAGPLWIWLGIGLVAFTIPDHQLKTRL